MTLRQRQLLQPCLHLNNLLQFQKLVTNIFRFHKVIPTDPWHLPLFSIHSFFELKFWKLSEKSFIRTFLLMYQHVQQLYVENKISAGLLIILNNELQSYPDICALRTN